MARTKSSTTDSEALNSIHQPIKVKLWKEFKKNGRVYKDEGSERIQLIDPQLFEEHYKGIVINGKEQEPIIHKLGFRFEVIKETAKVVAPQQLEINE